MPLKLTVRLAILVFKIQMCFPHNISIIFILILTIRECLFLYNHPLFPIHTHVKTKPATIVHDIGTGMHFHMLYCIQVIFAHGCDMILVPGGSWTTVGEPSPWERLEVEYSRQLKASEMHPQ